LPEKPLSSRCPGIGSFLPQTIQNPELARFLT
jgi:hypothetical protein